MNKQDIIKSFELNRMDFLINNKEEVLGIIHQMAQVEDIRSYVFLVSMINYSKNHAKKFVAELSNLAAFISLSFFNYIEGMIQLSYFHQKEAVKYDLKNTEYKRIFYEMYFNHPDVEHDIEFEKKYI